MNDSGKTLEQVRDYYGKVLQTSKDLQTSACCTADSLPPRIRPIMAEIHPEVKEKYYGCGTVFPEAVQGATVLDLGSGSGLDAYIFSKLVGPEGRVIGLDMTDEQLEVARRHVDHHTERFGYSKPNVDFRKGFIEDLESAGIASDSVDLIVSNCVINLSPDKPRVFKEIFRVLKPGGELFFSDVYAGRRIPEDLRLDPVLHGECLAGALYTEDFRRLVQQLGCLDPRVYVQRPFAINNPALEAKIGMIDFYSITYRVFKLDFEDICENYGQVAYYKGTIAEQPHAFTLDDHHVFRTGMPVPVCGNTADMLQKTRYREHFTVTGDKSVHYGPCDCAPAAAGEQTNSGGACC